MSDSNFIDVADAELGSNVDHKTKLVTHIYIHPDLCEYNVCLM